MEAGSVTDDESIFFASVAATEPGVAGGCRLREAVGPAGVEEVKLLSRLPEGLGTICKQQQQQEILVLHMHMDYYTSDIT